MSTFEPLRSGDLQMIAQKLESLSKSFSAGFPGLQNAGRTQTSAIAIDNLEPTLRSITLEEQDFLLLKDIQQVPAKSSVYQYAIKTAVRSGVDLWGMENFLPQEDHAKYSRVAEVLKVQGIRKTITHMAELLNDVGAYMVDLEAENDQNASLALSESLERSLYNGGDLYMNASGAIDGSIAADPNGPIRQIRGIQAQIREGNRSARGIIGDFVGYGNNQATLFDAKGSILSRELVDKVCTAVRNNRGKIEECHCTTNQLQAFRTTFFPFERGDMSQFYAIKGAGVEIEPKEGFSFTSITGNIQFIPSVFKFGRLFPEAIAASSGPQPATPAGLTNPVQTASNTTFKTGEVVKYVAQAVNVHGMSFPSAELEVTITADGNAPTVRVPYMAGIEELWLFRTEANGASGSEMFCGRIIANRDGLPTDFVDNQAILPGLDGIVFLPKKANRSKLAVLGNLLTKMQLGRQGLVSEVLFVSYLANILEYPRMHALVSNVHQELNF